MSETPLTAYVVIIRYGERFHEMLLQAVEATDPQAAYKHAEDQLNVANFRAITERRVIAIDDIPLGEQARWHA